MPARVLVLFRNDLRVHDNPVLHQAAEAVKSGEASEVLPVYCFDPRFFGVTKYGHPKTGAFRAQFQLESVLDLKARLKTLGSDLLVAVGRPEDVVAGLLQERGNLVLTQEETCSEELRVDRKVRSVVRARPQSDLRQVWGSTLFHREDLPFDRQTLRDMPDVFTPFKEK